MELGLFDAESAYMIILVQMKMITCYNNFSTSVDREAAHGPHCLPV